MHRNKTTSRIVNKLTKGEKNSMLGILDRLSQVSGQSYSREAKPELVSNSEILHKLDTQLNNDIKQSSHKINVKRAVGDKYPPEFYEYFTFVEDEATPNDPISNVVKIA